MLDVAETEVEGHGRLHVLEVNCINGSGLYAADVQRLVTAIERLEQSEQTEQSEQETVAPAEGPG